MKKVYDVGLTLEELKVLDGYVSDKAQKVIDTAKKENSFGFELPIMGKILSESEKEGKLSWRHKSIRSCNYCDKKRDYHRYPRNSKYHNKGDKNLDKPLYYRGVKFNEGGVTIQGLGDMCNDCCDVYNVKHKLIDYILDNNLKIEIMKNDYKPSRYLKDPIKICYSCELEMLESEMGKRSTMMGDGSYPAKCPNCQAESVLFGESHKVTKKFDVIDNPAASSEVIGLKGLFKGNQKIKVLQARSNMYRFSINDGEFRNGSDLLKFNTRKKIYYSHFDFENKAKTIEILEDSEYIKAEKSWDV